LTPPDLRTLLADSVVLWGATARVTLDGEAVRVDEMRVTAAAPEDLPIRWWLERPGQRRPCTSVLGLLRSLRNALGGGDAQKLRVV
jgi:hypothetical protein